jgi:L-arabinokinase
VRIAVYVTGHGLGHASRCEAVAEAILAARPDAEVELRTPVPRARFAGLWETAGARALHTHASLDPGVVQGDSFHHDLEATLAAWTSALASCEALAEQEAAQLRASRTRVVVSDVSPFACLAAHRAGLPVLLLGNFTWDWILEAYLEAEPRLAPVCEELRRLYALAVTYLRLPMSAVPPPGPARVVDLPLVARRARRPREEVRASLGLGAGDRAVLLCFGGFGARDLSLDALERRRPDDLRCVWDRELARTPWLLSAATFALHYSDLVRAADLVLSKPGFSTIADAVAQRRPLAYVPRDGFRESPLLEGYLEAIDWPALRLPYATLADGSWAAAARAWLDTPRARTFPDVAWDGAAHAAREILAFCS